MPTTLLPAPHGWPGRPEYTCRTLRGHFGLPRPENQFARRTAAVG